MNLRNRTSLQAISKNCLRKQAILRILIDSNTINKKQFLSLQAMEIVFYLCPIYFS